MLKLENLNVAYGRQKIIHNLNLVIPGQKVTALIGPNGCGKSTLLKAMSKTLAIQSGTVLLDQKNLDLIHHRRLAQLISVLPQNLTHPEGLTVRQLTEYGRTPYISHWGKLGRHDREIVNRAMEQTGVAELAERPLDTLSGGQRQRAWIAMVLAQDTPVVMLDEPMTFLDLSHQIELTGLIRSMHSEGKTVIVVLHDLNQAARYCDHLVVLKDGCLAAQGEPRSVFNTQLLESVFSLRCKIIPDPVSGAPMCVPL